MDFFRSRIQAAGASRTACPDDAIGINLGRRNIEEVRRAIRQKLQREYNEESRREFASFARRHTRVLVVSSDDFDYAYQIFLTINDRGKRLSIEDIFRGEILGPLGLEQRQRYETVIDEMDKYRESAEKQRSKGKTFFSHLAAISGWRSRGIIEGLKRSVQLRGGPRRFTLEVFEPMAEAYLQIKGSASARQLPRAVEDRLGMLRWLERHGDDDWIAPAMVGLVRLARDMEALETYLTALDRFAHGLMMLGCGRDARRKHYTPILKALADGTPLAEPETLFAIKIDDQRQILRRIATRLHQIDPPTAKLVLVRADQDVSRRPVAYYDPLVGPDRPHSERFTVEHLCPKGELAEGEWSRLFPDVRRRSLVSQCIGNLVLVTEAQNKRANQHEFAAKKAVFFPHNSPSPFQLTDMVRSEEVWDSDAIERRYRIVMHAVQRVWRLEGPIPECPAIS